MQHTISNEYACAVIDSHAAEVVSFYDLKTKKERVWCRDKTYWANCNPLLFPLCNSPDEGKYQAKGQTWTGMGNHGFARRAEFRFLEYSDQECTLIFDGNDESRSCYPYKFRLMIHYQLQEKRLLISVHLDNLDAQPLPFEMGFHPAFNCPRNGEPGFNNVFFEFEKEEMVEGKPTRRIYLKDACYSGRESYFFYNDVLTSDYVTLFIDNLPFVRVSKKNFSTLGFWRKEEFPFVCIEPWFFKNDLPKGHTFQKGRTNNLLASQDGFDIDYYWEIF